MNVTSLLENIPHATESTLNVYEHVAARLTEEKEIPASTSILLSDKIDGRRAQIKFTKRFADEIRAAVNAMPLLGRIEEAVKNKVITEDDQLQLIHLWEMRKNEILSA